MHSTEVIDIETKSNGAKTHHQTRYICVDGVNTLDMGFKLVTRVARSLVHEVFKRIIVGRQQARIVAKVSLLLINRHIVNQGHIATIRILIFWLESIQCNAHFVVPIECVEPLQLGQEVRIVKIANVDHAKEADVAEFGNNGLCGGNELITGGVELDEFVIRK